MRKIKPTEGTVISGTHNPADLLPALVRAAGELDILHDLDMGDSNLFECLARPGNAWGVPGYGWMDLDSYRSAECAADDVETLFEALDEHAGYYGMRFGAHENDGADFGFWKEDSDATSCGHGETCQDQSANSDFRNWCTLCGEEVLPSDSLSDEQVCEPCGHGETCKGHSF